MPYYPRVHSRRQAETRLHNHYFVDVPWLTDWLLTAINGQNKCRWNHPGYHVTQYSETHAGLWSVSFQLSKHPAENMHSIVMKQTSVSLMSPCTCRGRPCLLSCMQSHYRPVYCVICDVQHIDLHCGWASVTVRCSIKRDKHSSQASRPTLIGSLAFHLSNNLPQATPGATHGSSSSTGELCGWARRAMQFPCRCRALCWSTETCGLWNFYPRQYADFDQRSTSAETAVHYSSTQSWKWLKPVSV